MTGFKLLLLIMQGGSMVLNCFSLASAYRTKDYPTFVMVLALQLAIMALFGFTFVNLK